MNSWLDAVDHWKQGTVYPHWAALAHYGYGEARFIFYPPFSWTLGGLLGLILPWKMVPAAYTWLVLTLAGCSMFSLAKTWLSRRNAIIAAMLYAANPYNLVIVYWRSDQAELLASIYLPLLLLLLLRMNTDEDGGRAVFPLSFLMAAGWLTNLPSAVMMNYSLGVLSLMMALRRRSFAVLLYAGLAVALGAMLAGFFLLPAYHQKSWVNIGQVLAPGVRPQDGFLFTNTADPDHNRFNLLVSIVALSQFLILAETFVSSRSWRKDRLWRSLLVWSALSALLMFRFTLPLWNHLPELRFVQLPWRWLLCLNVPFALMVAMALQRWWWRIALCAVMLGLLTLVWHRVQNPWWDNSGDIQEMLDNQQDGTGNEGVDEYVPIGVDPYDADQKAPLVRFEGSGQTRIDVQEWAAEKRRIVVHTQSPGELVLRLFNYPLWKVQVNGRPAQTSSTPDTGQMIVPISAGESRIQIYFVDGWDRKVGWLLSASAFLVLALLYAKWHQSQIPLTAES
ncbi:MAG TPA: 6-pyruvoyl-tetrahydropterin synthase-related protein [Terriglobales bacterium]|nr:6-pyruvoyl-tetrahydropterin synthase-related protein [Terriglobales bacterium]